MSIETIVQIDTEAQIKAITGRLGELGDQKAAAKILRNSVNSAARKARQQMIKSAAAEYAVKDKKALKDEAQGGPKVYTAKGETGATIRSRGPMQDIMAFMTRPNTATSAAAAQVLKGGSMKPLEANGLKAFVTTFASGHTAIVQRHPPAEYSTGRGTRSQKYGDQADMTKIKKLLAPAMPMMMGKEAVMGDVESRVNEILDAEVQKRIDKLLLNAT